MWQPLKNDNIVQNKYSDSENYFSRLDLRVSMSSSMYLPGTASLLEELDKRLMVLLRDGRTLIGYLRSVDQFANLVLHRCIERIHVGNQFGDIPRCVRCL